MKNSKTFEEMINEAKVAIMDSTPESSVYVGCDSLRHKKGGKWHATYSTCIVLHMSSKHGGKIFHFTETLPDYGSMKQRLLNEVGYCVRAASDLIDANVIGDRSLEIHCDINPSPNHKSSVAAKEAIGYIRGTFGFDPKLKPLSWCATHSADHIVRH